MVINNEPLHSVMSHAIDIMGNKLRIIRLKLDLRGFCHTAGRWKSAPASSSDLYAAPQTYTAAPS